MVLEFILITKWDEIPRALCMGDPLLSHSDPLIVHGRLRAYPLHQPHVDSRKVRPFRLDIHYLTTYISLSLVLFIQDTKFLVHGDPPLGHLDPPLMGWCI